LQKTLSVGRARGAGQIDVPDKTSNAEGWDTPFEVVDVVYRADFERPKPLAKEDATEAGTAHPEACERAEEHTRLGLDEQLVCFLVESRG
jgi:hypothetical protein